MAAASQASTGAMSLPLELQQHIFDFLDSRTFAAARKVCRSWRFASTDSVTLERQLRKLPIAPPADVARETPRELARLYDEATRTLMLGMRVSRQPDLSQGTQPELHERIRTHGTSRGSRSVVVDDGSIDLYESTSSLHVLVKQRQLAEFEGLVSGGPWLNTPPLASRHLALSRGGRLLAIAKERTIQIIDLLAEGNSSVVHTYGTWATGQSICGLAFEHDDYLLRVSWNDGGRVVYYGAVAVNSASEECADMLHWKGRIGLKHIFVDTTKLVLPSVDLESSQEHHRLAGLQLLQSAHSGFHFAAQQHGGGRSSHYVYGHIRVAQSGIDGASTIDCTSVTMLSHLDSYLSSMPYTLNCGGSFADDRGLWENMPSAHEHHPSYTLSSDGSLLLLAERSKKELRYHARMQLFVYRLPSLKEIDYQLGQSQILHPNEAFIASFEARWGGLKRRRISMKYEDFEADCSALQPKEREMHRIGRLPICLGMALGSVTDLTFRRINGKEEREVAEYQIDVSTNQGKTQWSLMEF
ncbi:hypothetical protein B0A48_02845 [Cryoendolithus antarcticus]|uniref:F-box domain-containing protein n=1 Tax=Cryoendolithus antarcticus TaxID=1507870 RepID=A0A1V8TLM4_9PEZI|nr:hypothetical protein B0A48_02845 [Cryoendolithus antarcticus]